MFFVSHLITAVIQRYILLPFFKFRNRLPKIDVICPKYTVSHVVNWDSTKVLLMSLRLTFQALDAKLLAHFCPPIHSFLTGIIIRPLFSESFSEEGTYERKNWYYTLPKMAFSLFLLKKILCISNGKLQNLLYSFLCFHPLLKLPSVFMPYILPYLVYFPLFLLVYIFHS